MIRKWIFGLLWVSIAAGAIVLLVAAIQVKDGRKCAGVNITISGVNDNFFVDKKDIMKLLISNAGGNPVDKPTGSFDLRSMEAILQKDIWVKSAQLFFDNNEKLQVNVLEREPEARVFTTAGSTFYLDTSVAILPLSDKFSARLPIFTNCPLNRYLLNTADSSLLRGILAVSISIQKNPFLMAMIDQVDITPQRTFEMIPKFGNTVIVFGDATDAEEKLNKLQLFYKEVVVKAGWNKYTEINVRYKNQVVAKRKGAEEIKADSIRTLQLMKTIAENAKKLSGDSMHTIAQDNEQNTTNSSLIQQSIQRDDNAEIANTGEQGSKQNLPAATTTAASNTAALSNSKPPVVDTHLPKAVDKKPALIKSIKPEMKPAAKAKTNGTQKPKLLMPKPTPQKPGNEYQ